MVLQETFHYSVIMKCIAAWALSIVTGLATFPLGSPVRECGRFAAGAHKGAWTTQALAPSFEFSKHTILGGRAPGLQELLRVPLSASRGGVKITDQAVLVSKEKIRQRFEAAKRPGTFLIDWVQDSGGHLQPVFSPSRSFQSDRAISDVIDPWEPAREAREIPLSPVTVTNPALVVTPYWDLLSTEIRALFESGKILVTDPSGRGPYSILMHVTPPMHPLPSGGRTGLLLCDGFPTIVRVGGEEYAYELKLTGRPEGGFVFHSKRWHGAATGAAARREFNAMRIAHDAQGAADMTLPVGMITFTLNGPEQGYLLRLAPGTLRASHTGNVEIDSLRAHLHPLRAAYELGHAIGRHIPSGLLVMTHTENLILRPPGRRFALTDFMDVVPLFEFPAHVHGREWTVQDALTASLHQIDYVAAPGPRADKMNTFISGLYEGLGAERPSFLGNNASAEAVVKSIWEEAVALAIFRSRHHHGQRPWIPETDPEPADLSASVRERAEKDLTNLNQLSHMSSEWKNDLKTTFSGFVSGQITMDSLLAKLHRPPSRQAYQTQLETENGNLFGSPYFHLWYLWTPYPFMQSLLVKHLREEGRMLRDAQARATETEKKIIDESLQVLEERLVIVQRLSPHEFALRVRSNEHFWRDIQHFPYTTSVPLPAKQNPTAQAA